MANVTNPNFSVRSQQPTSVHPTVDDGNKEAKSLPLTYHEFSSLPDEVDLPVFFPETPLLARSVIFTRSEIDLLRQNPAKIKEFKISTQKELQVHYD